MARKGATENKAATETASGPTSLEETNEAADKAQADSERQSKKIATSGEPPSREDLAKSGYQLPENYFEQEDPNADQPSTEQRAGDGGADSPAKE